MQFQQQPTIPLNQSDYPKVKWWMKKLWQSRSDCDDEGSSPDRDNDSDDSDNCSQVQSMKIQSTNYLESKKGLPLNKEERHALYQHAHLIWTSFASTGSLPSGYKTVSIEYLT
jgi:hypothetical protein